MHRAGMLILGELHGSQEFPRLVADIAAAAAATGDVVVALELSADAQPAVDEYMESSGTAHDLLALLSHPAWQTEDGRTSAAVVELVETCRKSHQQGGPLTVALIDARLVARCSLRRDGMVRDGPGRRACCGRPPDIGTGPRPWAISLRSRGVQGIQRRRLRRPCHGFPSSGDRQQRLSLTPSRASTRTRSFASAPNAPQERVADRRAKRSYRRVASASPSRRWRAPRTSTFAERSGARIWPTKRRPELSSP